MIPKYLEMPGQPTPSGFTRTLEQAELDTEAVRMRSQGWTFRKIGDAMGCSIQAASDRYHRALAAVPSEAVEQHRKTMTEQIDELLAVAFEQAMTGKLWAIDRCVVLMDRKAKLHGLDAPTRQQVEVFNYEPGSIEYEVAQLAAILDAGRESLPVGEAPSEARPVTA